MLVYCAVNLMSSILKNRPTLPGYQLHGQDTYHVNRLATCIVVLTVNHKFVYRCALFISLKKNKANLPNVQFSCALTFKYANATSDHWTVQWSASFHLSGQAACQRESSKSHCSLPNSSLNLSLLKIVFM